MWKILALEFEGSGFRPGADDQVVGLVEPAVGFGGVDVEKVILRADAAHETRNQAPAGDGVDHGVLFGQGQRVLAEWDGAAQDGDRDPVRTPPPGPRRVTMGDGIMP